MARAGVVAKAKVNLPVTASFQAELEELKQQLSKPTGNKIKLDDKVYALSDGTTAAEFDAVVVGFVHARRLYESSFKKGTVTPAACYATNKVQTELAPHDTVARPAASACATCPNSKFAANGDRPKCQTRMLVALAQCNGEGELMILDLPVKAIKPFEAYINSIARQHQVMPYMAITKFGFDQSVDYDKPAATFVDKLDDEVAALMRERREEAYEILLNAYNAQQASNDEAPKKRRAA